jgi:hypothetical protein
VEVLGANGTLYADCTDRTDFVFLSFQHN